MKFMYSRRNPMDFLLVIIFLQSIVYLTVLADVPVARQVVGFIYFTFIPGFIILNLLKLDGVSNLEIILFSAGLSVSFLTIGGLLSNTILPIFGILEPLSLTPLALVFNSCILAGGTIVYMRKENIKTYNFRVGKLFPSILFVMLPVLSVIGAMSVNVFDNNLILLIMLVCVALSFAFVTLLKESSHSRLYVIIILVFSISLLLHSALVSRYLTSFGSDIPFESYLAAETKTNGRWSSTQDFGSDKAASRLNSMLSVTILPATYSILLNMDVTLVLKIIYPLIFSLVPLALYQFFHKKWGRKIAFGAAFLFIAQQTFFTEMLGLARQMVAELFFVLLLLVIFHEKMKPFTKILCFLIFSVGLITSHYGVAEIFLFLILASMIALFITKRSTRSSSKYLSLGMILIFLSLMFSWYVYTSRSAVFDSLVSFGDYVYSQLDQFLNPAARGQVVLTGLGLQSPPSIWNAISRVFAYLTEGLIIVGFIGLVAGRTTFRLSKEYHTLNVVAVAILASLIIIPGLANTLNMTRFYHVLLFILAPLFVIGVEILTRLVSKKSKGLVTSILLIAVLVPYFLFQTGFVYEVTKAESWSFPLSQSRMDGYKLYRGFGYIEDLSFSGSRWMQKNVDPLSTPVYADLSSMYNVLTSYGHIYRGYVRVISNVTQIPSGGILYLTPLNTWDGLVVGLSYVFATDELPYLNETDQIYSNGGCEIYSACWPIGG